MEGGVEEEIRGSLVAIVGEQNKRLTAVTRRQNQVIAGMSEELDELRRMVKELQEGGGSGGAGGSSRTPRPMKLDLQRFTGEDPQGWIDQAKMYFLYHGIADEARLQIADFHMSKEALGWIRGLKTNGLLTTWERFVEDLKERFGASVFEDKLEELSRLQQTTSVAEYMARFEALLNDVSGQSEETLLTIFIGGLKQEIKNQLKINRPTTLRKALATTKVHEANKGYKYNKYGGTQLYPKSEPLLKTPPAGTGVPIVRRTLTAEKRKE